MVILFLRCVILLALVRVVFVRPCRVLRSSGSLLIVRSCWACSMMLVLCSVLVSISWLFVYESVESWDDLFDRGGDVVGDWIRGVLAGCWWALVL